MLQLLVTFSLEGFESVFTPFELGQLVLSVDQCQRKFRNVMLTLSRSMFENKVMQTEIIQMMHSLCVFINIKFV